MSVGSEGRSPLVGGLLDEVAERLHAVVDRLVEHAVETPGALEADGADRRPAVGVAVDGGWRHWRGGPSINGPGGWNPAGGDCAGAASGSTQNARAVPSLAARPAAAFPWSCGGDMWWSLASCRRYLRSRLRTGTAG